MKSKFPSVSFITCTFNSQATLKECLDSVKMQDYPKEQIEVIIVDGGSKDSTIKIAKKYSFCKIHTVVTDGPEEATAIGYNMSQAEYVVNFPSDNIIPNKKWLQRMIEPLENDKDIIASETLRYIYRKNDKPLNKYFALFGMNDPIAFYVRKQDRAPYFRDTWHLAAPAEDKGDFYKVQFTKDNLPTVGANGFVIRRKIIQKVSKNPKKFFHMDTCVDLLGMGHDTYAFVKNDIWHKTGEELINFLKKRKRYATILYFNKQKIRRYHLYNPATDRLKLLLFIIFSLTFIEPLIQSIRGYIRIKDPAWFLHPVICFMTTVIYTYAVIQAKIKRVKSFL